MKRLGVQKSVMITRDFVYSFLYCTVWTVIEILVFYFVSFSDNMGLGLLFLFIFLQQF